MKMELSLNGRPLKDNKPVRLQAKTFNTIMYRRYYLPLFEKAVDAFLEELVTSINIDTGMSISSVAAFASMSHNKSIVAQFMRGYDSKRKYSSTRFPGVMDTKGTTHGQLLGERAAVNKEYELEYGSPTDPTFKLTFNIQVLQYYLHEHAGRTPNSGDWRSVEKAYTAFRTVWDAGLDTRKIAEDFCRWVVSGEV